MMDIRKVVDSIRETEVVALCQELIRIISVNPPGDEIRIAEFVGEILGKAGTEEQPQDAASPLQRASGHSSLRR